MEAIGKITQPAFDEIFAGKLGHDRSEVTTGANFGVDVSIVNLPNNQAMALTSDPLSLIPSLGLKESAWLSVHLMANDMATTGMAPMYAQFVLNLPPWLTRSDFKTYWNHIHEFCDKINVAITGGHTGSIEGQNSTIAGGGTMISVGERDKILVSKNAQPGDLLLVTKQSAIVSTAILAMSFPQTVKSKLGREVYLEACELFYKTTSLKEALLVAELNETESIATAMHDVTEGGILGAAYEMAVASGNGLLIDSDKIPVGTAQQEICNLFSIDPKSCIGAGAMLIAVKKGKEDKVIGYLAENNISCSIIGEFLEQKNGIKQNLKGEIKPLIYQHKDPYWDAFFNAIKKKWK